MGNIGMVDLRPKVLALRDRFNIGTFIETGTYKCATTVWAAEEFERVITIEAYKPYYERARDAHAQDLDNVSFLFGDSRERFPEVLSSLDEPALIWLDAHWCGNVESSIGTNGECPLIEELEALNSSPINHFVMIDDARLFAEPPPYPHDPEQWPDMQEVRRLLTARHPKRIAVWNDAIIAVPPKAVFVLAEFADVGDGLPISVLTSNEYIHAIPAFAYLFNKYWDGEQDVTIIRYDHRPPSKPSNFHTFAIGNQDVYTWSEGLIKYLNYFVGDFILLLLEDYFISDRVDVERVMEAWAHMEDNDRVVKIDLSGDRLRFPHDDYSGDLEAVVSLDNANFQTSLQAAIWRADFLRRFLRPSENPWQFEKKGTKRVIAARRAGEFDGLILGLRDPPIKYINAIGGEGNHPQEYDRKKFPREMLRELSVRGLL